ncbi:hypothetical protein C2845_PM02G33530 [Panicum miliaceum]|uniref:Uncharacterized protein n=1 Tax=Panicum miliaceum TaxID=4540 RepID=A0A3L6SAU2_PANMI|nr:hypothetical protein C2845_PM02G33530 [Panicum miliaceum]
MIKQLSLLKDATSSRKRRSLNSKVAKHPPDQHNQGGKASVQEDQLPIRRRRQNIRHRRGAATNEEGWQSIRQTMTCAIQGGGQNKAKPGTEAGTPRREYTTIARTRRMGGTFGNESIGKLQSFQNDASEEGVAPLAPSSSDQSGQNFCPESTPETRDVRKKLKPSRR